MDESSNALRTLFEILYNFSPSFLSPRPFNLRFTSVFSLSQPLKQVQARYPASIYDGYLHGVTWLGVSTMMQWPYGYNIGASSS